MSNIIVIDFETNSAEVGDVVEVAIFKLSNLNLSGKYDIQETFHRYYKSKNAVNKYSLAVHNLSPSVIEKKRVNVSYAEYFYDDKEFEVFCKDADTIVAHNLSFELRHISNRSLFSNHICTMKENKKYVCALNKNGLIKMPNLGETCYHFNVPFDEEGHHSAIYDITKTLEIFNSMQ